MGGEESWQRRVENKTRERQDGFEWLIQRVKQGRLDLLRQSRLTGIEKEARLLWSNSRQVATKSGRCVQREIYG